MRAGSRSSAFSNNSNNSSPTRGAPKRKDPVPNTKVRANSQNKDIKKPIKSKKEIKDPKIFEHKTIDYSILVGEGAFGKVRKCYIDSNAAAAICSTSGSSDSSPAKSPLSNGTLSNLNKSM